MKDIPVLKLGGGREFFVQGCMPLPAKLAKRLLTGDDVGESQMLILNSERSGMTHVLVKFGGRYKIAAGFMNMTKPARRRKAKG